MRLMNPVRNSTQKDDSETNFRKNVGGKISNGVKSSSSNLDEKQKLRLEEFRKQEMEDLAQILAKKYGLPYINLLQIPISIDALKTIPEKEAKNGRVAAFAKVGKILKIVLQNPNLQASQLALNSLKSQGYKPELFLGSENSLAKAWSYYKDVPIYVEAKAGVIEISTEKIESFSPLLINIDALKNIFKEAAAKEKRKTTEVLEIILAASLNIEASDIHFEPTAGETRLRFRLDGALLDILNFPKNIYQLLLSRIKLISELKLNVHDRSQDGRFSIKTKEAEIEVRTSVLPGPYGETIVLRILHPKTIALAFEDLGVQKELLETLYDEIKKPNGMILTTGPTGAGKTTTLYAFMKKINSPELKIITIEDPIEYRLAGISQTQVDKEKKYDFGNGLKAILRQDPDIIMVGEIRDFETAETAIHASLTGHLVFSTLHTNNAAGTIPRLIDLGVKSALIGPAINAAIAQRLVRKLCPASKIEDTPTEKEKKIIENLLKTLPADFRAGKKPDKIWRPKPCPECNNTGFKGRVGVFEIFRVDDKIEKLISENSTEADLQKAAIEQGMLTIQQDGILKILNGITSFDEVEKVVGF